MKTLKYSILVLLIFSFVLTLKAEDSIVNRNITVEREYKPVIQDAGKIKSVPKVLEPKIERITPTFNEFNLPLNAEDQNIHTLPAAELQREKRKETSSGFARFGLGNYWNTLADFAYPLVKTSDIKLDFSLNHVGTFGSKTHSTTKAALSFDKYFNNFDLFAGIGGGHEYLKYYGNNFNKNNIVGLDTLAKKNGTDSYLEQNPTNNRAAMNLSLSELAADSTYNTFWRYNGYIGIRSLPITDGLRYQAQVQYNTFNAQNGLVENQIHAIGGFDTQSDNNRLGLDFDMVNLSYKSNIPSLWNLQDAYTVFTMNPFYSIERKEYDIHLGVKSSFSFVHGRPFSPSADIHAEWRAIPKYFAVYGGITGGYNVNSMDEMFSENRFLYSDVRVNDTYSPIELYAGFKVKPLYNLLLDAFVDYRKIDNQYFFVNKKYKSSTVLTADSVLYSNRFNVLYSATTQMKIGVRASYNYKNKVNVQLKGAYNAWEVTTEQYAWNKPNWEANLTADMKITHDISVSANVFYESERWAKLGNTAISMNPKVDINLGGSYSYNNWFTAFLKINNLINNHYQEFYGYEVQGFNILAAVAFSF